MRFCDLSCPEAEFPKNAGLDGAGSCRTFVALYCRRLDRLVHKNAPCPAPADRNEDDQS
ncbi:MAG: hypothetical protein KJ621_08920 [Proteobacteria bacterium]|nr:hypothetical protein [Pseudomonadota bacterium]